MARPRARPMLRMSSLSRKMSKEARNRSYALSPCGLYMHLIDLPEIALPSTVAGAACNACRGLEHHYCRVGE